ncbi:cytochrome P450 [Crossiella sp. SN42]|uniref:cytochrome P450 n=1 Tax=Crossiella sp. SN42 TaxID=2944808 RepID=UPI00207CB70D|nr:cytochrome P450 [Crossiella sp. SN42]MCO1575743.1 cytochrome P450 [Crossiella sp. SN42]
MSRHVLAMLRDPYRELMRLDREHGPVIQTGFPPLRFTYLLGPAANQFVFANSGLFRWREAFQVLLPVGGETALIVSDGEPHRRRRRLVQPAFHHRHIRAHAELMRANADAELDTWRPGQVVDVYQAFRAVVRRSTIQALFGPRLAADEPELGRLLQIGLDLVERPPLVQQLSPLARRRAARARAEVADRVRAEIARRDRDPEAGDVLALLVAARDEDGAGLSETEVVDQVISLIAAGYDTTSAAMSWVIYELVRDPAALARAKESAQYREWAVNEALRLYPPAVISARKPVRGFDYAGHRIRADGLVIISPYVTHRLPELFPDPLRFDPERWDPARPGYRKPGPHEFLPFSGGAHRCIGASFATMELTVLLDRLLQRAELDPPTEPVRPVTLTAMRPKGGLWLRVRSLA